MNTAAKRGIILNFGAGHRKGCEEYLQETTTTSNINVYSEWSIHMRCILSPFLHCWLLQKFNKGKTSSTPMCLCKGLFLLSFPFFHDVTCLPSNTLFHLPLLLYSSTVCPFYPSSKNLHLYGRCHTAALVSVNENKTMSLVSTSFLSKIKFKASTLHVVILNFVEV